MSNEMSSSEAKDYIFQMQREAVLGSWKGLLDTCIEAGYDSVPYAMLEQVITSLSTTTREGFEFVVNEYDDEP